jgi:hypothetical protein
VTRRSPKCIGLIALDGISGGGEADDGVAVLMLMTWLLGDTYKLKIFCGVSRMCRKQGIMTWF